MCGATVLTHIPPGFLFFLRPWRFRTPDGKAGPGAPGAGFKGVMTRRPRRDPMLHKTVRIVRGPHKGLIGIVTDVAPSHARIELHTNCKTLTIPLTDIKEISATRQEYHSSQQHAPGGFSSSSMLTPRAAIYGAETPAYIAQTPSGIYSGARTPALGGRTPHYGSGGETPHGDHGMGMRGLGASCDGVEEMLT